MMNSVSLPDAIQWSEGMLLSPQHFQQNDYYWQQHLRHRLQILNPCYWGVLRLNCQLLKEVICISQLECVLPDGQLVEFPGRYPRQPAGDLQLDLSNDCKTGAAPQRVWLLVKPRGANAACQGSKERRYNSIIDEQSVDENTGEGGFAIARLQLEFQLYLAASSPSTEGAVALCEVVRGGNGQLAITAYHPPMLRLDASAFQGGGSLFKRLNELHELLWHSAQKMAAQCSHVSAASQFEDATAQYLNTARVLARCLPQLSVLLRANSHPCVLYEALAYVVAQVSGIGSNPLPLLMRPYQHDDCYGQFLTALEYIEGQLAQVDMGHESLSFMRVEQFAGSSGNICFECRLPANMNDLLVIELTPNAAQTAAQLLRWLTECCIANESLIPQLRRARLPGARVRALSAAEIKHCKLSAQAAIFVINNQPLIFAEAPAVQAFTAEQVLRIIGKANAQAPAGITLHCINAELLSRVKAVDGAQHE